MKCVYCNKTNAHINYFDTCSIDCYKKNIDLNNILSINNPDDHDGIINNYHLLHDVKKKVDK